MEKVYFRSQILECPRIGEYWNISGVPVLPENVIFTFFGTCWCYSEAYNTRMQKWSSIVQYSCTSIWDFKYTFSKNMYKYIVIYILNKPPPLLIYDSTYNNLQRTNMHTNSNGVTYIAKIKMNNFTFLNCWSTLRRPEIEEHKVK